MLDKKIPIPFKDMVLCEKRIWDEDVPEKGFFVKEKHVDEYIIVDLGEKFDKEKYPFGIGDHVLVSSTGSEFILEEKRYWLFEPKEIIGKIWTEDISKHVMQWKNIVEESSRIISDYCRVEVKRLFDSSNLKTLSLICNTNQNDIENLKNLENSLRNCRCAWFPAETIFKEMEKQKIYVLFNVSFDDTINLAKTCGQNFVLFGTEESLTVHESKDGKKFEKIFEDEIGLQDYPGDGIFENYSGVLANLENAYPLFDWGMENGHKFEAMLEYFNDVTRKLNSKKSDGTTIFYGKEFWW